MDSILGDGGEENEEEELSKGQIAAAWESESGNGMEEAERGNGHGAMSWIHKQLQFFSSNILCLG